MDILTEMIFNRNAIEIRKKTLKEVWCLNPNEYSKEELDWNREVTAFNIINLHLKSYVHASTPEIDVDEVKKQQLLLRDKLFYYGYSSKIVPEKSTDKRTYIKLNVIRSAGPIAELRHILYMIRNLSRRVLR